MRGVGVEIDRDVPRPCCCHCFLSRISLKLPFCGSAAQTLGFDKFCLVHCVSFLGSMQPCEKHGFLHFAMMLIIFVET